MTKIFNVVLSLFKALTIALVLLSLLMPLACAKDSSLPQAATPAIQNKPAPPPKTVSHKDKWGIYELDITTRDTRLIYSTPDEIFSSALRLNSKGDRFVFAQKTGGKDNSDMEIYTLGTDGNNLRRLTNNRFWDLYPVWAPDESRIAFLSKRDKDLDIYNMDSGGANEKKLYDSGDHDADIDWAGKTVVFTSKFKVWRMSDNATQIAQVTEPANAGQWGKANLPVGDYDPRLSYDGTRVVFERLEDAGSTHGSYNIFTVNIDGTGEKRLTGTGNAQGLASWSRSGAGIAYVVAAINDVGKYDIYLMNLDGSDNRNITPDYFPAGFLCYSPVFSADDSRIFFIGQWWE